MRAKSFFKLKPLIIDLEMRLKVGIIYKYGNEKIIP